MTYREMQKAEAELLAAIAPQKKQRGATKAQLEYRTKRYGLCEDCGLRKDICREVGGCQPERELANGRELEPCVRYAGRL